MEFNLERPSSPNTDADRHLGCFIACIIIGSAIIGLWLGSALIGMVVR